MLVRRWVCLHRAVLYMRWDHCTHHIVLNVLEDAWGCRDARWLETFGVVRNLLYSDTRHSHNQLPSSSCLQAYIIMSTKSAHLTCSHFDKQRIFMLNNLSIAWLAVSGFNCTLRALAHRGFIRFNVESPYTSRTMKILFLKSMQELLLKPKPKQETDYNSLPISLK